LQWRNMQGGLVQETRGVPKSAVDQSYCEAEEISRKLWVDQDKGTVIQKEISVLKTRHFSLECLGGNYKTKHSDYCVAGKQKGCVRQHKALKQIAKTGTPPGARNGGTCSVVVEGEPKDTGEPEKKVCRGRCKKWALLKLKKGVETDQEVACTKRGVNFLQSRQETQRNVAGERSRKSKKMKGGLDSR